MRTMQGQGKDGILEHRSRKVAIDVLLSFNNAGGFNSMYFHFPAIKNRRFLYIYEKFSGLFVALPLFDYFR
jgi:hypothetical protein